MLKADPKPTDLVGLDAWLPEPGAPPFVGLDRTVKSDFFTRRHTPESWHVRARRRVAYWLLQGVGE